MWIFGKKKSKDVDLSWLGADMHSHLIPAIDDGAPDTISSLELIKGLKELGFKKLVTTPHVYWDFYPNTFDIISEGVSELRRAVADAAVDVEIHAAAEYFLDEHFEDELEKKLQFLCVTQNALLVEFSMLSAKIDLQDVLFKLQINNYQPLIAHPERYTYLMSRKEVFDELKNIGCLFQLNLMSLTGYYGKTVQELAEYLVKKDFYDYAGTDLHHSKHLATLRKLSGNNFLQQLKESGRLKNNDI